MRRKRKPLMPDTPLAPVPSEILDQFGRQRPISPEELDAAVRRFKKNGIIERALGGELTHRPGYAPGGEKRDDTTNHRNRTGSKTVLTDDGPPAIAVPRDRDAMFEPQLILKHDRRFTGFNDNSRFSSSAAFPPQSTNMAPRMDAAGAVDAQNASTALGKAHSTRFP